MVSPKRACIYTKEILEVTSRLTETWSPTKLMQQSNEYLYPRSPHLYGISKSTSMVVSRTGEVMPILSSKV